MKVISINIYLHLHFIKLGNISLNESYFFMTAGQDVTEQEGGWFLHDKLLQKGFPLSVSGGSFPHAHLLGSQCPPPEERRLSMPETGEKERNCLFKCYTNLE